MGQLNNYIAVNHTKVPLLAPATLSTIPVGEFIDSPIDELNMFEPTAALVQSRDMYLPNFSLRVIEGKFFYDTVFSNQGGKDLDLLGSCLFFKGTLNTFLPGKQEGIQTYNQSQNFKFDPNNEYQHFCPKDTPLHFVNFSMRAEYLNQFLPENESWANLLKTRISKRERIIGNRFIPIKLQQENVLQNIFNCPLSGKLGQMLIEASITQILLLQLPTLFQGGDSAFSNDIPKRDVEVVQALKEHLSKTFLEDHSMTGLAKNFCTNTNKLMVLFKKVFKKSIFEYISELRMEYACQLLLEKDVLVTEVARTVGYKNANHFSTAFKRKYGLNPSELR